MAQKKKSQAKPLFIMAVCLIIFSSAVFAGDFLNNTNETTNTMLNHITKIIDFVFNSRSITARLVLENNSHNSPLANKELIFFENQSKISYAMTNSSGHSSVNYSPIPGIYNLSVYFNGTENLSSSLFHTIVKVEMKDSEHKDDFSNASTLIKNESLIVDNSTLNRTFSNNTNTSFEPIIKEKEYATSLCLNTVCESSCNGTTYLTDGKCDNNTGLCNYIKTENSTYCRHIEKKPFFRKIIDLFLSSFSILQGELITIRAHLYYENNTPASNEKLDFYKDSAYLGSNITDLDGIAVFSTNTSLFSAGNHTIIVEYNGSFKSQSIEIISPDIHDENSSISSIFIEELELRQEQAKIGVPVKWLKKISAKNVADKSEHLAFNVTLDASSSNILMKDKSSGKIISEKKSSKKTVLGINALQNKNRHFEDLFQPFEQKYYEVYYETPAPLKKEGSPENIGSKWRKNITVSSDYSYSNVLSYTDILEAHVSQIHLFWKKKNVFVEVTNDKEINTTYFDTNGNGKIDRIYWNVPHLSSQIFEVVVELNVINVQSYPTVGGNWTVFFNTTGTADLTITSVNGTSWSNIADSNDLKFLKIKCGENDIDYLWINNSVFVRNYSCITTGYEISKVITTGKHHLMFVFGNDVGYANNFASGSSDITFVDPTPSNNSYLSYDWMYVNITSTDNLNQSIIQWANSSGYTNVSMDNSSGSMKNWYVNMTSLSIYSYNYTIWAENTSGSWQESDIMFVSIDTEFPNISFTDPTPTEGNTTSNTWAYINVSVSDSSNTTAFIDWNSSLVGWWRFNNESGENNTFFRDWSSYGNNGTCTGTNCSNYTTGKFGKGMQFDGVNDSVYISNLSLMNFERNDSFSIETWIKTGWGGSYNSIIGKMLTSGIFTGYDIGYNNGKIRSIIVSDWSTGNNLDIESIQELNDSNWKYVVITYNGSSSVSGFKMYINSILESVTIKKDNLTDSIKNDKPLTIGSRQQSFNFNGTIDEVRIWNRALSEKEINASYNAGLYRLENNFTGLQEGNYTYTAYAQDLSGNLNQTETRNLEVDILPSILFTDPTPTDGNTTSNTWAYINVSVSDSSNTTAFIDWNSSLVGWWRFNNESGENNTFFRDWSSYGNNGTCTGTNCSNYTTGKFGKGMQFDGFDDYVNVSDFFYSNVLTVEVWVKPTTQSVGIGNTDGIVSKRSAILEWDVAMTDGIPRWMAFNSSGGAIFNFYGGLTMEASKWYHIATTYNGTVANIYINGILGNTTNAPGNIYDGDAPVTIGNVRDDVPSYHFNGTIDEVKIWNRALSEEEINASYNAGLYRLYHNFTNLTDSTYNYTAYAQDLAGNVNQTETRNIIVTLCTVSCDSTNSDTCFISTSKEIDTGCLITDSKISGKPNLELQSGGSIYSNINNASFGIDITGNLTIKSGASILGNANITALNLTVESGGTINTNGKGYPAADGPGKGNSSAPLNGGGGTFYGSIYIPERYGSGGGNGSMGEAGGSGGGFIKLNVTGPLVNKGSIKSDGYSGITNYNSGSAGGGGGYGGYGGNRATCFDRHGGGGSGGSIYIIANSLSGNGSITSNGGRGGGDCGPSGSGGRIAIYFSSNNYDGSITAYGGGGNNAGASGTIYLKDSNKMYGNLILDNNGTLGERTPLNSSAYPTEFDTLTIRNDANLSSAVSLLTLNATTIMGNGTISLGTNSTSIKVSNISMSGGIIASTSGHINITFTNSVNTSNFVGTVSSSSGTIRIWYGASSADRCDISGTTVSGTIFYYYAPWSNTTSYRCVQSIVFDNTSLLDLSNSTRTQLNTDEVFYPSVRIREYNGTDYFDVGGEWNILTYNSNGSVPNSTLSLTNYSGSYLWRTQDNYNESLATSYSFFANITGNSSVGMGESSLSNSYFYTIKGIYITETLSKIISNPSENINVSGHATLQPDGTDVSDTNASVYVDEVFQSNATTNSTGFYNYTFSAPQTAGNHTVKVNMTDSNGIIGTNSTVLGVRINLTNSSTFGILTNNSNVSVGEHVNFSVSLPNNNIDYPALNLSSVWANVSWLGDSQIVVLANGNISGGVWWGTQAFSDTGPYNVTFYANLTDGFNEVMNANTTFDVKQINITANLSDSVLMPEANVTIIGKLFDNLNELWVKANTFVRIFLDGIELTNGGHYTKTWTSNSDFSNGTHTNTTQQNGTLILDARGEFYFEAENYLSSANFTNTSGDPYGWREPSGDKFIEGIDLPEWATYNITNIPNGTYYIFFKMFDGASTRMINVTWDGVYIGTTEFDSYSGNMTWSKNITQTVTVNSSSHMLGINSTDANPYVDVILLTTNSSFVTNNTGQNYTNTALKYNGYFTSNKTIADYPIISITPSWISSEPSGSNITIDISADNGTNWCSNVTNSQEYRLNESCGAIGTGTEIVWRANLTTNNPFVNLYLENITIAYETGNATKTNSSGFFSFLFKIGSILGWHNLIINSTDSENIAGNLSLSYFADNFTISAESTPDTQDADSLSETLTVIISSNAGRASGTRYNITATVINPDSSTDTIQNSSFSCSDNYPMTCSAVWSPGAVQPPGYYNVTIDFEDNESITGQNTTYNDFRLDNITTTIYSSDIFPLISNNITISGTAKTYSSTVLDTANITLETQAETHICGYNTSITGTQDNWSVKCILSSAEYSDELGPATITVYLNDTTGNITGTNSTQVTLWASSKVNYTTTTNYTGTNTEYNITAYYWRTDKADDEAILGELNITILNATYNLTKTCAGTSACLKTFSIGSSGELIGGNYTIYINASNSSAYYLSNSTSYNIYLEEPKASGTLVASDINIYDVQAGQKYSFLYNVTLNNDYQAKMYYVVINNISKSSYVYSVDNISNNCDNVTYSDSCYSTFNITLNEDPPVGSALLAVTFDANYTNNDGSYPAPAVQDDFYFTVMGNPDMSLNQYVINITDNIGSSNTTAITVNSIGNVPLGESSSLPNSVFVEFIEETMNSSWISFSSADSEWNSTNNSFDFINDGSSRNFDINITATTYDAGTYTGKVNITSYRSGGFQTFKAINISVTIASNMTISNNLINITDNIGFSNITEINISSTGNAPLTNVTIQYIPESLPLSWINFSSSDEEWNSSSDSFNKIQEYSNSTLKINITAKNYTSGNYTGKVNITTNEGVYKTINLSVVIFPSINVNVSVINITNNISQANITRVLINNTGNAPLTNVTISLINSTIPDSWVLLDGSSDWNSSSNSFSKIYEDTNRSLNITINVTNYTSGTYTGILNITNNENQNSQINLSVFVNPTASLYNLTRSDKHGTTITLYHIVNSTGNAPITNTNVTYLNETLPLSWVTLNYSGQSGISVNVGNLTEGTYENITVEINIPKYQAPGEYIGYINTTFDNEPAQQITVNLTVNTNASWYVLPPINKSNSFTFAEGGVIGNITINNTGNVPLNFTISYNTAHDIGGDLCNAYSCLGSPPTANNPASIYVDKNSTGYFNVTTIAWSETKTNISIEINLSNTSATPIFYLTYMLFNITNAPPVLVNLTTTPNNYVELNKSISLYAVVSDDETNTTTKGLNLTSVYFNVTNPVGYVYQITNDSINWWDDDDHSGGSDQDRKKFNYSFINTSIAGIHNLTLYIKDKSGNEINATVFQFEVIDYASLNITATNPSTAANVTRLHGENLTVPINITNIGKTIAYNLTITGTFGATAENWTLWNKTYEEINESQIIETNITIMVANSTDPGTYQFTPKVIWTHPNLSINENTTSAITITVASNPEIMVPSEISTIINHGESKTINFEINSTGNVDYSSPKIYNVLGNASWNWTCFNNYCSIGGTHLKSYGDFFEGTSTAVPLYLGVDKGTIPGNYTTSIEINSTGYTSERYKTVNITLNVPEDRNWTALQQYNQTSFSLNTPGIFSIITLNFTGNIETNFTITYNNWSDTDYHSYSGLFNESQNNSGIIVNPTSILLSPNEAKNITVYHNGYNTGLSNIGVNVTISNASALPNQSVELLFNLTEASPQIPLIVFLNESYVELNKTIEIKIVATDDAALNLSSVNLNITDPFGSSVLVSPENSSENETAYGEYIKMNFTYLFNSTSISGMYNVTASVSDKYGVYSVNSSTYSFEVIGATTFNMTTNSTIYNVSGISQALNKNITISINLTNNGSVTAYGATISGFLSTNASTWIVYNTSLGNVSASSTIESNVTINVKEQTVSGTYYFTPRITWTQPNQSLGDYNSTAVAVTVASNRTAVFGNYHSNYTIDHGMTNSTLIELQSIGNDNATTIQLFKQNVPSNLTVNINQTTISNINAGESKYVVLNITPAVSTPNNTYSFQIEIYNDGSLSETYDFFVMVPPSFKWQKNLNETTINGVSNQNAIDTSVSVTNNGNNPISYTFSLAGNVSDANIMGLIDASKTLQPQEQYYIQLNHTANNENNYYEGTLKIQNGSYYEDVTIKYYSYIAEMNILNISPNYDLISGNSVNVTTQFIFGTNNITENTTYTIKINGTACTIASNTTQNQRITHLCTAPDISDGKYHDLEVTADYNWSTGIVTLVKTNTSAVYYKDITAPKVIVNNVTSDQEILKNVTINLSLSDNVMVDTAIGKVDYPNGTFYQNITLSNTTITNYSAEFTAPGTIGTYTITYYVNDTTGNQNNTVSDTFEIYEWKNFSGNIIDLNSNPVNISFKVFDTSNQSTISFQTNSTGHYNITLKRKLYDIEMVFLDSIIFLNDIDFSSLPTDFIDVDRPLTGDYGFQGTVIKGFAVNTSISANGNLTINYTSSEATGLTTNYFEIYKCSNWNYLQRNCISGLSKITSTHDKINRKLNTTLTGFSAYLLVEDTPSTAPEMTIAASQLLVTVDHGTKNTGYLTIQSTGSVMLTNVQFSCISGTVCTEFSLGTSSIIGLDSGASYDAPINVTVPAYYAPGTYDGILSITSNTGSIYAQYDEVTLKVTVPQDNNWSVTSNLTLNKIGSGLSGTFGTIDIRNNANVPISFGATLNTTYLGAIPPNITISKNNSDSLTVNYTTPPTVNFYNYSINITGAGNTSTIYAIVNLTHAVDITSIQPNTNISAGQLINITATADYLGTLQTENISWTAYIDDTPCTNISSNYSISEWILICEAPNMSARLSYTLKVKGTFLGNPNLVAYDSAYDVDNIYYVDVLPPQVAEYNSSFEKSSSNITINTTITDYSNITNVSVTVIAPNGTSLTIISLIKQSNNSYSFTYNFTDTGDYVLRYLLTDSLNNSGTEDKYFEIYENMTFSGTVERSNTSGLSTTFKLYRQNQNYSSSHLIHEFTNDVSGFYNKTIHRRLYDLRLDSQSHVIGRNNIIKLYNINMTQFNNDPIDIDVVLGNEVQISGTEEMGGLAVRTNISSSGRITVIYLPDATTKEDNIYLYRCSNWNFTEVACGGTWTKLDRNYGDLDKINDMISSDISGFSAYIAAEVTPPLPVDITGRVSTTVTGGGGGGGGGGADVSNAISDIKQKITSLIEGTSDFSVDAKSISKQLLPGERSVFSLGVKNGLNKTSKMAAKVTGAVSDMVRFEKGEIELGAQESGVFSIEILVPKDKYPGNYEGTIVISNEKVDTIIPVSVRVLDARNLPIAIDVQPLVDKVTPNSTARIKLNVQNRGPNEIPINYTLLLIDPDSDFVIAEISGASIITSKESFYINFSIPENISLGNSKIEGFGRVRTKNYIIKATAYYETQGQIVETDSVSFLEVTERADYSRSAGIMAGIIAISAIGYFGRKRYMVWLNSKKKYLESIDFKTLPQASLRSGFIGKIAETDLRTFIDFDTLQTHTVVAGSTGGGKTVAAQVIVEEALLKGVSAIVFDPTAQWTGFLRPNRDKKMLKMYRNCDMKVSDSRAFNGNIYEIKDPRRVIDITKYMNPGEITIFTLNHLDTKEIDFFVANTVKQVFHAGLEGSQKLKLLLVYDEVHRLLKKYGGSGEGFIQIERAVREFRKWGVGLVLISQVLSDFIGTIKANIGTDIQLRTRDENDLERIKIKYGEDFTRSIVRAAVGEAMIENAQYNKGKPYFVLFRPLLHSIERLPDKDLESYSKYNNIIDDMKYQLECLKAEAVDVFDLELELKLSLDNLMKGKFNMVDIYLQELEPRVASLWKKIGREPKKRVVAYTTEEEIQKEVERAKREREDYIKKQKLDEERMKKEAFKTESSEKGAKIEKASENKEAVEENNVSSFKKKENISAFSKSRKDELDSIKAAVINDMRERAMKEDLKAGVSRHKKASSEHLRKEKSDSSAIEQKEKEVKELYSLLKKKISEKNKKGKDISMISLKAMSIPSDIKLAIADNNAESLDKVKRKISMLLKNL